MDILNLDGLEVLPHKTVETEQEITIGLGRRASGRDRCPRCEFGLLAPNGTRVVGYRDLPIRGKPVLIEWERQRFKCRSCGDTCSDEHPLLHPDFQMTRRLYDWIGAKGADRTFASIAGDVGLDERTVRRVFDHWSDAQLATLPIVTPKWLGIDEVHLLRAARGVLTNIGEKTLIDVLPNRNQESMRQRLLRMPARDRVELVAIDMWAPYRRVAEEVFPRAVVVVDKWHLTKYADQGMETIRKRHRAGLTAPMRKRLVKDRFLLLKRGANLRPEQRLIMQTWTHHFPDLAAAYDAKEAFYAIYDCPTRQEAEAAYEIWESGLTPEMRDAFAPLLSAVRGWREQIFNYFDHPITNAYTEAINGLIKIANRNGRGYSFSVLRTKMMLSRAAARREQPKHPATVSYKMFDGLPPKDARTGKLLGACIATLTWLLDDSQHFTDSTENAG